MPRLNEGGNQDDNNIQENCGKVRVGLSKRSIEEEEVEIKKKEEETNVFPQEKTTKSKKRWEDGYKSLHSLSRGTNLTHATLSTFASYNYMYDNNYYLIKKKEQCRRSIPSFGFTYFSSSFLSFYLITKELLTNGTAM